MSWLTVAENGYPAPTQDADKWREFFCWAPGWTSPMVLEAYENPSGVRGFCGDGGAFPEITHYMEVAYPEIPKQEKSQ